MKLDEHAGLNEEATPVPGRGDGLTLDVVWASLVVLLPALVIMLSTMGTVDLAYHLRAGSEILATHALPRVDTFTFAAGGTRWVDQQWGAQVVMAFVNAHGGFASLLLMRAILVSGTAWLVFRACRARGAQPPVAALLTLVGVAVTFQTNAMRPQLFALPLFAATLLILTERRRHPAWLWAIPAITVVWVNLHGSFVLAPALIGLALIEDLMRHDRRGARALAAVGAVTLAATAVDPFGIGVWRYAIALGTDPVIRTYVTEWAPISFATFTGVAFFASVAAVAAVLGRRGRSTPWSDLLWLGAFFVLALPALRNVVWWAMVAPVVVAGLLPIREGRRATGPLRGTSGSERGGSRHLNVAMVAALVVACAIVLPYRRPGAPASLLHDAPDTLVAAVGRDVPAGSRVMVAQPWGSWFEYALPSDTVFVDSRIELFPSSVWKEYVAVRAGRVGWQDTLDRYGVDAVAFDPTDWPLADAIARDAGWREAYRGADGVVYVRAR